MKRSDISTIDVLLAAKRMRSNRSSIVDELQKKYIDYPEKVLIAAVYRENDRGLLDYGVSVWYSFLTEAGEQYIKMSKLSTQDFNKVMHDFNQLGADVIAEHLKSHLWRCEHVYWLNAFQAYFTAVPSASKDITDLKEKHVNGLIEYFSKNA